MLRGMFNFQDLDWRRRTVRTSDTQYVETECPMTYVEGIILDAWQGSEDRGQAEPEHRPAERLLDTNECSWYEMFRHS